MFAVFFVRNIVHSYLIFLPQIVVKLFAQPPKVQQKTKEQKMAAAMAGGKGKKKKWSKGKQRDKVDNKVLFTKEQFEKLESEVPKMKLITVSSVVEKLKISGGLARRALNQLAEDGAIRPVCVTRSQRIYTRNIGEGDDE
jgi:small subunit ribosomal protein S25e